MMFEIEPKYLYLQSDISFWICFALVPTCKRLRPGAVPTINLPKKSIHQPLQLQPDMTYANPMHSY